MPRKALITGITGQDGAYLARFLLDRDYAVYGVKRLGAPCNSWRLLELGIFERIHFVEINLLSAESVRTSVAQLMPDEVYHLAAQSFSGHAWTSALETVQFNTLSTAFLLESLRQGAPTARFFQASSSELFAQEPPELKSETSRFEPLNPYATAKLFAQNLVANYRDSLKLFACSGMLFNHESPLRGEIFVTRKITRALSRISVCRHSPVLQIGNLEARRDWGWAEDFVEGMWLMLQQSEPRDLVLATGETHSVREFVEAAAERLDFKLRWDELGAYDDRDLRRLVEVSQAEIRQKDTGVKAGDASLARDLLGWVPKIGFLEMVDRMVKADVRRLEESSKYPTG